MTLNAKGSTDPDGDRLTYEWWQYADVDTCDSVVELTTSEDGAVAGFVVPGEPGKNIHVILEVTDDGDSSLTRYQRVIVTISE